jgi:3-oxoacyl-(acyl-carrier-protein) synthase
MSLASAYAIVAADEAIKDADWKPKSAEEKQRTGWLMNI